MNAKFIIIVLLLIGFSSFSQDYKQEIIDYQEKMNKEFADSAHSPLPKEDLADFSGLDFFPVDEKFKVNAKFIKDKGKKFEMKTSTKRLPVYQRIGFLHFVLHKETLKLAVYKNIELSKQHEFKNYLFIPFKDLTNGMESYGGGRYLDIERPGKGQSWVLDFNKAYNPYCAYSYRYSCPVPPEENHLQVEIKAGVKKYHE